jgi:hypothetical protein
LLFFNHPATPGNQKNGEIHNMKYNGWHNYETWLAACTLLNDEHVAEQAKQTDNPNELQEFFSDYVFNLPNGIALQLLHNFICELDWEELYNAVKEEA